MSAGRQASIWVLILCASLALLYLLRDVLTPFVAGLALAYLLDPVASRLQRLGLGRTGATVLILVAFLVLFVLTLIVLAPLFASQIGLLIERLPGTIRRVQAFLVEQGAPLLKRFGGESAMADGRAALGDVLGQVGAWAGAVLRSVWSGGQAVINLLSLMVITPVVAFYLLNDWGRMVETIDSWLPRRSAPAIREIFRDIDAAMSGFIRGQSLLCLILMTWYGVALTLVGLNSGLLIGVGAGLVSFIPYVGSLLGLVVSIGVAIAQFWPDSPGWILVVAAIFLIGQFFEGYVLAPKLVGASVGLHPVWLMFALLAFGSLLGFVGLLLAVPLAATVGVLVRHGLRRYLGSALYTGPAMAHAPSPETDA